jgi:hypothetical protein
MISKSFQKLINFGRDVGKLEPSYFAGKNVKWCSHGGKQFGGVH